MEDGDVVEVRAERDAHHVGSRNAVLDVQGPLVEQHHRTGRDDEEDGNQPSGRAADFADDIGEDDVIVDGFGHHAAPLGVLPESDVVALERVADGSRIRVLAVAEQEAGRHFFPHPVATDLIELQPVTMALRSTIKAGQHKVPHMIRIRQIFAKKVA